MSIEGSIIKQQSFGEILNWGTSYLQITFLRAKTKEIYVPCEDKILVA